jgi:hypothetical protein
LQQVDDVFSKGKQHGRKMKMLYQKHLLVPSLIHITHAAGVGAAAKLYDDEIY